MYRVRMAVDAARRTATRSAPTHFLALVRVSDCDALRMIKVDNGNSAATILPLDLLLGARSDVIKRESAVRTGRSQGGGVTRGNTRRPGCICRIWGSAAARTSSPSPRDAGPPPPTAACQVRQLMWEYGAR